jgi:hypothetical protein
MAKSEYPPRLPDLERCSGMPARSISAQTSRDLSAHDLPVQTPATRSQRDDCYS